MAKLTPALQLITLVRENLSREVRESNRRREDAVSSALMLAISAGLTFGKEDFRELVRADWLVGNGEGIYARACDVGNTSACQSYEHYVDRPPFIQDGKRLYVGSAVQIPGENLRGKVTSFTVQTTTEWKRPAIVCCTYKKHTGNGYSPEKVDKRFVVTVEELRAGERAKLPPPPDPEVGRFMKAHPGLFHWEDSRRIMRGCQTLRQAWEKIEHLHTLKSWVAALELPIPFATVEKWKTIEEARAAIDFDALVEPTLAKYRQPKKKPRQETEPVAT